MMKILLAAMAALSACDGGGGNGGGGGGGGGGESDGMGGDETIVWPISGTVTELTQDLGGYAGHKGTDIRSSDTAVYGAEKQGDPIYAAASGTVVHVFPASETAGNLVVVSHGNKVKTRYLHLHDIAVAQGTVVRRNETILGHEGGTGYTEPPGFVHLHFEIFVDSNGNNLPDSGEYYSPNVAENTQVVRGEPVPNAPTVPGDADISSVEELPAAPSTLAPAPGTTVSSSSVFFDWSDVPGADAYAVAVFDSSGFPDYQSGPAGSSDTVALPAAGTYTFTVSAHNSAGWGPAAQVTVTYAPPGSTPPPAAPTVYTPSDGATISSSPVAFDWSDVMGSDLYKVVVTNGSGSVVFQSTPGGSAESVPLPGAGGYIFKVQAHNSAGWGPSGQVTVTYSATPPDLTVFASVSSSCFPGQNVQVPVTVQRAGGQLTSGSYVTVRLYWSSDSLWSAADQPLWESNGSTPDYPNSYLNAYGAKTATATIAIPAASTAGYVIAIVDPTGYHAEASESNNAAAYSVALDLWAMQVTSGPLNVRIGPGTAYSILGQAATGQVYVSDQTSGGWYRIWWGDGQGWCSGDYLAQVSGTGVKVTGSLNVRSGPGTGYSILGTTAAGENWYVTGTSGEWYRIWWKGQSAWIWNGYAQTLSL